MPVPEQDPRSASPLTSLALLVAGTALMLSALDLIPIDPARLHAPRWVLFAAGLAVTVVGALLALARRGASQNSPRYLFLVGVLLSAFTAVALWVVFNQEGVTVRIGPFTWRGPGAERFGITMAAIAALVVGAMGAYAWRQWWRALRGRATPGN